MACGVTAALAGAAILAAQAERKRVPSGFRICTAAAGLAKSGLGRALKGFYRIAAAAPRLHLGDPAANAKELVRLAKGAAKDGVAAIVFPELCLTGYTCGDMFFRDELLTAASAAAETFFPRRSAAVFSASSRSCSCSSAASRSTFSSQAARTVS